MPSSNDYAASAARKISSIAIHTINIVARNMEKFTHINLRTSKLYRQRIIQYISLKISIEFLLEMINTVSALRSPVDLAWQLRPWRPRLVQARPFYYLAAHGKPGRIQHSRFVSESVPGANPSRSSRNSVGRVGRWNLWLREGNACSGWRH